ncbi:MAG: 4-carboxymuconolactone decarboxylase [Propionibacteriales bacterium]|nr:4-carboxymuconolactone decarboxylase [Propionibacteriales bacterium]
MTEDVTPTDAPADLYEAGLAMRKQVLGADHVERSLANASDFGRPIQELVTEYCWGKVWTRDGLQLRERSMLNLAMLTVLNRGHELSAHVRGAVRNGLSTSEIREVLLQAAIYAGVPAALESVRIAEKTLAAVDAEQA